MRDLPVPVPEMPESAHCGGIFLFCAPAVSCRDVHVSAHTDVKTKSFLKKLYANVQLSADSAPLSESVTRGAGIREDPEPDRSGEKAADRGNV